MENKKKLSDSLKVTFFMIKMAVIWYEASEL